MAPIMPGRKRSGSENRKRKAAREKEQAKMAASMNKYLRKSTQDEGMNTVKNKCV